MHDRATTHDEFCGGSRPRPGGPAPPPVVVQPPPPVFLGTNYDALSAVLIIIIIIIIRQLIRRRNMMDCNICVTSVYCLYYPLMSDHELIDLSYYVYLDIWRL